MKYPTLVDSHCHLDFKDYNGDITPIIELAEAHGVGAFLNICTTHEEIGQLLQTAHQFKNVFASVGIHPHEALPTLDKISADEVYNWLIAKAADTKVIAIGETGLDYYYEHSPKDVQQKVFSLHIQAAQETGLPLSVHTRAAQEETIHLLRQAPQVTGVIHCFSETQWLADAALDLGFYISLSGIITFKKTEDLRKVAQSIPLNRLLLETDAPFLAPVPHRGKRNEPAFLIETARVVAALKGVTLEEMASITTENFFTLFNKAPRFQ
jgi:TatD DNase family protein